MTWSVHDYERQRSRWQLERQAAAVGDRLAARINQILTILVTAQGYVTTRQAGDLPRERFARFVESLGNSGVLQNVLGMGISEIVPPRQTGLALDRLTRDYGPGQRLWPDPVAGRMNTAIMMLEPDLPRARATLGFDLYSDPLRAEAMDRARAIRQTAMTAPVNLVNTEPNGRQTGALIFTWLDGTPHNSLEGWLYASLRMDRLFEGIEQGLSDRIAVRATDVAAPDQPLFARPQAHWSGRITGDTAVLTMPVAGRIWQIEVQSLSGGAGVLLTMITGLGALALATTAALGVRAGLLALGHSEALTRAQQHSLQAKDLHLREMSHRLKNVLARVSAMARHAARHTDDAQVLASTLERRLQAMARAQDLLTRNAKDGADLRALIEGELGQIDDDPARETAIHIFGPAVWLVPDQTQPLGLALHELSTNTLKYGAGSSPGGSLAITWDILVEDGHTLVHLVWDERMIRPPLAPARRGFGTQLIDSCVRLELQGTIERRFHPRGLTVAITFPIDSDQVEMPPAHPADEMT